MFATISAYQTSAQAFFENLQALQIDLLLDIRRRNTSQLCGFTKKHDLAYLVPTICRAAYVHDPLFAPDEALLSQYLEHRIGWHAYAERYVQGLEQVDAARHYWARYGNYQVVCLLGTATEKRRSHSEVLGPYLEGEERCHVRT